MSATLVVEDRGAVKVLILNRPQKRNALNTAMIQTLLDVLEAADTDRDIGCIVLTGAGSHFSAGADLSEFIGQPPDTPELQDRSRMSATLLRLLPRLRMPVIAAVNGSALGAGAGLALAADLVIMGKTASIGFPEIRHRMVATGMIPNLVRQTGRKAAFELLASGLPVDADRALHLGIINRVAPADHPLDEALAMAASLAKFDNTSMARLKQLCHECADLTLDDAVGRTQEHIAAWR